MAVRTMSASWLRPGLPEDENERRRRVIAICEDATSLDELEHTLVMKHTRHPTDWARLVPDALACEASAAEHGHGTVERLYLVLTLRRPRLMARAEQLNLTRHPAFADAAARLERARWPR